MKKILYVMNVDWNWIKQRPQFIAERLAKVYDISVQYRYRYSRKGLQQRKSGEIKLNPIYVFPGESKMPFLREINDCLFCQLVKYQARKRSPDIIYLTYPTQVKLIPRGFKGTVIYDCMDNHVAFQKDKKLKNLIQIMEQKLCDISRNILVSSDCLKDMIKNEYHINEDKITVVHNAFDGKIIELFSDSKEVDDGIYRMAYVGTIDNWFDWKPLEQILEFDPNVEIHLYGPLGGEVTIPDKSRMIYHGTVEHDKLYDTLKNIDCLLMPFIVNDIIEAVDPVKLYEYINFHKDIIVCKYKEIERYGKFVNYYSTSDEFVNLVENMKKNNIVKYTNKQRIEFLKINSWDDRVRQIKDVID